MKKKFICWRLRGENGDGAGKTLLFFSAASAEGELQTKLSQRLGRRFFPRSVDCGPALLSALMKIEHEEGRGRAPPFSLFLRGGGNCFSLFCCEMSYWHRRFPAGVAGQIL